MPRLELESPAARPRVAIIGAGVSGIATAHVLEQEGFDVVVFEKAARPGGVWATAYPGVRLQNIAAQYHISDFPWPLPPDLHPTGAQILSYLTAAIDHFDLDVRLEHDVQHVDAVRGGWRVRYRAPHRADTEFFDYVVVAVGQYSGGKHRPTFPGEQWFQGDVITERELTDVDVFAGRRVLVVGFGKSAVDMATMASARAASVTQVFREPRWLLPQRILGLHFTFALFNRFGSVMMTSWAQPSSFERFLHDRLKGVVRGFWHGVERVFASQLDGHARHGDAQSRARIALVRPAHPLLMDLRSACALAPEGYYDAVATGAIAPIRGELAGYDRDAVVLADGTRVPCDLVVLCVGSETPRFPFLSSRTRLLLEREIDGAQLYRHLVHPRLPRLGFAGFNHGFMHIPAVEVGALWLAACFRGEIVLPAAEEMEASVERVRAWKREHIRFEPSRSCAVNTRYQQYIDILLNDLGVSPYRKLPNVAAELFGRYGAADYRAVRDDYARAWKARPRARHPIAVDS